MVRHQQGWLVRQRRIDDDVETVVAPYDADYAAPQAVDRLLECVVSPRLQGPTR
jgi:hypothetical protein